MSKEADYEDWAWLSRHLTELRAQHIDDAQAREWLEKWIREINDALVIAGQSYRVCATCDRGGHECPGCGHSIAHGATDCGGCPAYEQESRATDLCVGDAIFSDATGQWHEVKEVGTHNGSTTIVIDRNNEQTFRFKVMPDTTFRTRLSEDHLTAIRLGAVQTIYSKGD